MLSRSFRRLAVVLGLPALLLGAAAAPASAQAPRATDMPASQAEGIIREITDAVGLQPRFELRATTQVDNAAAVVYGGRRYLLYNPRFLAAVNRAGHTDWAGISILAHEMGHHLNGHTLRAGGSQPQDELEADEFSGFVLRRLGASLAQAQAAMAAVSPEEGSATHPGRAPRLAAISRGWSRATAQITASTKAGSAQPSAQPVALAPRPVRQSSAPTRYGMASDDDASSAAEALARGASNEPVRVVGQLTFRDNPDVPFYLTSALNVVRLADESSTDETGAVREAEVVGHLRRTGNAAFPFILEDGQQRPLYVTPRGDVYNKEGQRVAKLRDPS
ncbi:membrane-binding protein [Hymenobacter sp. BRD128]|uniref:membrane-binding protein n=1 Tax=Hymenobacter sp. BRD128 TaxID=2675878 RepID=UPI0015660683|nr:membrane-binding protein [Hymenobacter sp. BRD128]QKG56130.1 membrane-binding protein [Hymenobacter sp. BRD128]